MLPIDAEKAFGRIHHFSLLYKYSYCRGVSKLFILLFYTWFNNMSFRIRRENFLSYSYRIYSGLLQGNLLSPEFFNVFVD